MRNMRKWIMVMGVLPFYLFTFLPLSSQPVSVAGLFPLQGSGRIVYNFNEGWRFLLGDAEGAEATAFDDSLWEVVCAPHADRLEPSEASGGRNNQGILVHFEAIMGKQWVYVNGHLVNEHLGGYLPVTIDLSAEGVKAGDKCVIAVKADNSDDKNYPPGKKQSQLDFAYHGGMYRDVWLIGKSSVAITDAIERGQVAGGGVFIHFDNISEKSADVFIDVETCSRVNTTATLTATIKDAEGKVVKTLKHSPLTIPTYGVPKAPISIQ